MTNTYFVIAIPWANGFSQMMVQCKIVMTVNGVAGQTGSGFRTYSGISTLRVFGTWFSSTWCFCSKESEVLFLEC